MKTVLFLFYLLLSGTSTYAQTTPNYYGKTKTIQSRSYTYQCDLSQQKRIRLYNKENIFTYEDMAYKSTNEIYSDSVGKETSTFDNSQEVLRKAAGIAAIVLSYQTGKRMEEHMLAIMMYANPETGEVIEVSFEFDNQGGYASIPLSVYRKIEMKLKKKIKFTPNEIGKQLNYILFTFSLKRPDVPKSLWGPL